MSTLSIKLSLVEKRRLEKIAAERKLSLSALLREGVEHVITEKTRGGEVSCYDLAAKYFESPEEIGASGLGDLSTNRDRLKDFGM